MKIRTYILGVIIAALPLGAQAVTVMDVTAPINEDGLGDGSIYGTTLNIGDIASVDVITEVDGDTTSVLGFNYQPAIARQALAVVLNEFEFDLYGSLTAYLSDDPNIDPGDVSQTLTAANDGILLRSAIDTGLVYVILDWTSEANNDFSYDLKIEPIPVPAAGLLLLGGLGGLAALRRRKK